jgi:MYXO-CTERM domain-containing protein
LVVGALLTLCSAAQAATLCSAPGPHPDGIDLSDVKFNGTNAGDCYGVVSGISTAANLGFDGFAPLVVNALPGGQANGSFQGIDFTLAASGLDFGNWTLGWTGGDAPATLDIVAVVQTSITFASYFFDDVVFAVTPGSAKGSWVISYLVNEDLPLLSSFSIYARDFRGPTPNEPPPPETPVDEPGVLALLALGGLGLALARRRTRR